jgi:hypothetical protein
MAVHEMFSTNFPKNYPQSMRLVYPRYPLKAAAPHAAILVKPLRPIL